MTTRQEKLIKIFRYALNQEKTGISFFETSLKRLGIGTAVKAFNKLIDEEHKHVIFISAILNDLEAGKEISANSLASVTIEPTDYFDARAKSEFLDECVHRSTIPDVTVFNTALLIERIYQFYAKMAARIDDQKTRQAFEMLSNWEKGHERFFQSIRDELARDYEAMPWAE